MAKKIGRKTNNKEVIRLKHRKRIRGSVEGTSERPRLAVFRSNKHLYLQVINDLTGKTLVAASTLDEELKGKGDTIEGAKAVGSLVAKRSLAKGVSQVVFDRGGYIYHGRVKALAEGAREGGLKF